MTVVFPDEGAPVRKIFFFTALIGIIVTEGGYIKKLDQKTPPMEIEEVGRFCGASRNLLTYELYQKMGHYHKLVRSIKLLRNWYKAHLRQFGIKWKWKGQGFTALDGVLLIKRLMSLNYIC